MTVVSSRLAAVILVLLATVANGLRLETPTSSEAAHPTTATPESEQAITNSDGQHQPNKRGSFAAIGERVQKSVAIKRILIGVYAGILSSLGVYIAWCQFNEAKSIPSEVLEHDIALAYDLLKDPELHQLCEAGCSGMQYFYAIFFSTLAILFTYQAAQRIWGFGKFSKAAVLPDPSNSDNSSNSNKQHTVFSLFSSAKEKYKSFELGVGGKRFWYKSISLLAFDIVMQSLKCFSGDAAYAKASAELMIAQIALMIIDVNLSMLTVYFQSTFGFAVVNENAELGYLAIRLSQTGHLGMRVTGFLDFVTLATPFVLSIHEIDVMSKFVQENKAPPTKSTKSKRRWGTFTVIVALFATIAGSVLVSKAVHAGFVAECPEIMSKQTGNADPSGDDFLPPGVYCEMWEFDFYLDPPCSCTYLDFDKAMEDGKPVGGRNAACTPPALQDPDHKVLQPVMPFIQGAQFMNLEVSRNCPIIKEDMQLIASFKKLSFLRLAVIDFSEGLGSEFGQLENLVGIEIVLGTLSRIDIAAMQSWRKLESFVCNGCEHLQMSDEFLEVEWPRLHTFRLTEVPQCPSDEKDIPNYLCLNNSLPQTTCPGVGEGILRGYVGDVSGAWITGTTLTRCVQPVCDRQFNEFSARDGDNDGLLNRIEVFPKGSTVSIEQFKCLVEHMREAALASGVVRQSDLDLYPREEVEQGFTYYEYNAWKTNGYTTCRDCNKCVTCESRNPPTDNTNTQPSVAGENSGWDCSVKVTDKTQKKACKLAGCAGDVCQVSSKYHGSN